MFSRILIKAAIAILGICAVLFALHRMLGYCSSDAAGCTEKSRIWAYLLLASGMTLALSGGGAIVKFGLEFRRFLKLGDTERASKAADVKEHLRAEAFRMKELLESAEHYLGISEKPEPDNLTPAQFKGAMEENFYRASLEFLLGAPRQPARFVFWLMASLSNEKAVYLSDDSDTPIAGSVQADYTQTIMRLVGDHRVVALMDAGCESKIGPLVNAQDIIAALRECELPVWKYLELR